MRFITIILLALSVATSAQTEEQQKQQKKAESSRPQSLEVQPSFYPRLFYPTYPIYPTYSYLGSSSSPSRSDVQLLDVSIGASIAASTLITDPVSFGLYATAGARHGLYLHARSSKSNPNRYYDNINRLEAEGWGDQYQGEFKQRRDLGIGYLLDKDQVKHIIGLNIQTIKSDLNYQDLTGILPYRGDNIYSIEREIRTKVYPMYGILHQATSSKLELGIQATIQRNPLVQASVGLSF